MLGMVNLDKDFRLTVPIDLIRHRNTKAGKYLKITLRKNENADYFYLRVPTKQPSRKEVQVRRKLSESVIRTLKLVPRDTLVIEDITKLETSKSDKPFVYGKFDLLSLPLDGLMIDTFIRGDVEWCRFWSSSKFGGRANEIELKRFVPINRNIGEFFGLMQAESRKFGGKFDFTNIFISEHKKFIKVAEILSISKNMWKFGLIYNPSLNSSKIEEYKNEFSDEMGIENSYTTKSSTITTVAYQIYISSGILNKIMNLLLKELRHTIFKEDEYNKAENFIEFMKGFIIKDLLGDGTAINSQDNSIDIIISEQDAIAQQDIVKMLQLFGINASIHKNHINLSSNLYSCLWLIENGAFIGHEENRGKLIGHVLGQEEIQTMFTRFSNLNVTSINEFAKRHSLSYNTSLMFLFRYTKKGVLKTLKSRDKRKTLYLLNDKGRTALDLIERTKVEYTKLISP